MLLRRQPKELPFGKDLAQQHLIVARAGGTDALTLPISTVSLAQPDSPTRVSSFDSSSASSTASASPTAAVAGHILAGKNAFEDVVLTDAKALNKPVELSGALNAKLSQLLEKRRAKETETLSSLKEKHAIDISRRESLHREELNMKDSAHRRIVDHMEGEIGDLRQQLQNALAKWEALTDEAHGLKEELMVEKKLRKAAEEEQRSLHRLLEAELEDM